MMRMVPRAITDAHWRHARAPRWWDEHVLPRLVDRTMSGPQVEGSAPPPAAVTPCAGSSSRSVSARPQPRALRPRRDGRARRRAGRPGVGAPCRASPPSADRSSGSAPTPPASTCRRHRSTRWSRRGPCARSRLGDRAGGDRARPPTRRRPPLRRAHDERPPGSRARPAVVQPVWGAWAGGCHLDRDIPGELERAAYALTSHGRRGWFVLGERPPHGAQRTQHTHRELTTCFIPPGV